MIAPKHELESEYLKLALKDGTSIKMVDSILVSLSIDWLPISEYTSEANRFYDFSQADKFELLLTVGKKLIELDCAIYWVNESKVLPNGLYSDYEKQRAVTQFELELKKHFDEPDWNALEFGDLLVLLSPGLAAAEAVYNDPLWAHFNDEAFYKTLTQLPLFVDETLNNALLSEISRIQELKESVRYTQKIEGWQARALNSRLLEIG
jgi:hypothetical protein